MLCEVLKPFRFSRDGISTEQAEPSGAPVDVPAAMVPGLRQEGYVRAAKAVAFAPENKAIERSPENRAMESAPENKGLHEYDVVEPDPAEAAAEYEPVDPRRNTMLDTHRPVTPRRGRPPKAK